MCGTVRPIPTTTGIGDKSNELRRPIWSRQQALRNDAEAYGRNRRRPREGQPGSISLGGSAGTGGASGQGLGGGLYIDAGAGVTLNKSTKVVFNYASTDDDNIFGTYTIT